MQVMSHQLATQGDVANISAFLTGRMMTAHHHLHEAGDPDAFVDHAIAGLRARGKRVTRARRLLLGVLARNHNHLTADEVADLLQEEGIHRVTVYRTLEALTEVGAVTHLQTPGGATAYHLSTDTHLHGYCTHCRKIVALPTGVFDSSAKALLRSVGFTFDPNRSTLVGVCSDCLRTATTGEEPS